MKAAFLENRDSIWLKRAVLINITIFFKKNLHIFNETDRNTSIQKPNAVVAYIAPGGLLLLRWKRLIMFRYFLCSCKLLVETL